MQINRTGYFLLALFGGGGLIMLVVPVPGEAGWILKSIGLIWLLVTAGLIAFARHQGRRAAHHDWVFENGVRGTATVVKASSNATVNEMPVMKLTLDLDVPGVTNDQVKTRATMPVFAANRMRPGLVLPVHVNPADPDDFVLVW